jgi:hypothetical protein
VEEMLPSTAVLPIAIGMASEKIIVFKATFRGLGVYIRTPKGILYD